MSQGHCTDAVAVAGGRGGIRTPNLSEQILSLPRMPVPPLVREGSYRCTGGSGAVDAA